MTTCRPTQPQSKKHDRYRQSCPTLHNDAVGQTGGFDRLAVVLQRAVREDSHDDIRACMMLGVRTVTTSNSVQIFNTQGTGDVRIDEVTNVTDGVRQVHPRHQPRTIRKANLHARRWLRLVDFEPSTEGLRGPRSRLRATAAAAGARGERARNGTRLRHSSRRARNGGTKTVTMAREGLALGWDEVVLQTLHDAQLDGLSRHDIEDVRRCASGNR